MHLKQLYDKASCNYDSASCNYDKTSHNYKIGMALAYFGHESAEPLSRSSALWRNRPHFSGGYVCFSNDAFMVFFG